MKNVIDASAIERLMYDQVCTRHWHFTVGVLERYQSNQSVDH